MKKRFESGDEDPITPALLHWPGFIPKSADTTNSMPFEIVQAIPSSGVKMYGIFQPREIPLSLQLFKKRPSNRVHTFGRMPPFFAGEFTEKNHRRTRQYHYDK